MERTNSMSTVTIGEETREAIRRLFPGFIRILQDLGIEIAGIEKSQLYGISEIAEIIVAKDGTKVMLGVMEEPHCLNDKLVPRELFIVGTHPLGAKKQLEQVIDEHNNDHEKHPWKLCLLQTRVLMEFR
ncbi:MAG: hypothetical protein UT22_C0005G0017 [Parcubacteria group bacterium GW2011_GWC2_39_11]|nr:MAG: hypothetical protein UT22_C0005G0017 [Parcubacteria group bacterium GW2011_GWC2_39_11]